MDPTIDRVESFRLELQDNIDKLQRSLRQWQTWEAEYDALREEVNALPEDASADDIRRLADYFGSEVISHRDVEELVGTTQSIQRSRGQIADLISRRLDWVHQNSQSAERKLDSALLDADEEGSGNHKAQAPQAEIIEQLDDDDNVVNGRLAKPGEQADEVLKMLDSMNMEDDSTSTAQIHDSATKAESTLPNVPRSPSNKDTGPDATKVVPEETTEPPTQQAKKIVSFSVDTKSTLQDEAPSLPEIIKGSFSGDSKVYAVDSSDRPIDYHSPYIPADESPEDARLRRQMMEYNMQEVGAVVAEMDLDDASEMASDDASIDNDNSDYLGLSGDDEDDKSESEEGEWGRSLGSNMTEEYKKEMRRLEGKLSAQGLWNAGPSRDLSATTQSLPDGTSSKADVPENEAPAQSDRPTSKSVRFAQDLDIEPSSTTQPIDNAEPKRSATVAESPALPVTGSVIERKAPAASSLTSPSNGSVTPKISRFKQAQLAAKSASVAPAMEASNTLVSDIVERPPRNPTDEQNNKAKKVSRFKSEKMNAKG